MAFIKFNCIDFAYFSKEGIISLQFEYVLLKMIFDQKFEATNPSTMKVNVFVIEKQHHIASVEKRMTSSINRAFACD